MERQRSTIELFAQASSVRLSSVFPLCHYVVKRVNLVHNLALSLEYIHILIFLYQAFLLSSLPRYVCDRNPLAFRNNKEQRLVLHLPVRLFLRTAAYLAEKGLPIYIVVYILLAFAHLQKEYFSLGLLALEIFH
nr:MAG TPA: hypothetical protein [Caudoviricetes sp.]